MIISRCCVFLLSVVVAGFVCSPPLAMAEESMNEERARIMLVLYCENSFTLFL